MATDQQIVRELNELIATHLDSVEVLESALEGIVDSMFKVDAEQMLMDHRDAATWLQRRVRDLGGDPATSSHAVNTLKQAWQKVWNGGTDRERLQALRANERVAVDGLRFMMTKENLLQNMSEEGVREHVKSLDMELAHFRLLTDRLRTMGIAVDNDEVIGAVRNAAEHIYAAVNLTGSAVESFMKWATGGRD